MASFICSCACRGTRPKKVELKNKHVREDLISKLMEQRNVLRFISAPKGFGKSTLCAQYAELVFSFKDVYWIDCKSPCFIRDLDANALVSQIIQYCESPNLVVFDDFKDLDDDRSMLFSKVIDELLEYGCEVVVNASPYNDTFIKYQNDACIIKSKDLLLTDQESSNFECDIIERIPVVAWHEGNSIKNLLECAINESLSDSIIFSLFLIYLFGNSSIELLKKFLSKSQLNLLIDMNKEYLYFGIDENKDSFSVPHIFTSELISLYNSEMQMLVSFADCTERSTFAEKLCSLLKENNNNQRCIELVSCIGKQELRIKILREFNEDSIRNSYLESACNLFDSISIPKTNDGLLVSYNALRLSLMGKLNEAARYSYSVLDNSNSTIDNKLFAALLFVRFGKHSEIDQALKILRVLNNDFKIDSFLNNQKLSKDEKFKCDVINKLIKVSFAIHSSSKNPFLVWKNETSDELFDEDIISAEFIISSISYIKRKWFVDDSFMYFINKISRYFNLRSKTKLNFYDFALIDSYLKHFKELELYCDFALWNVNDELIKKYYIYKKSVYDFEKNNTRSNFLLKTDYITSCKYDKSLFKETHIKLSDGIPKLRINIFGGVSAFLGNKEIIKNDFGRQNIKILCSILVIENGNEIGKLKLAQTIWPYNTEDSQRVNINSHWSVFRRLLSLEDGSCPYLIKNQNSYKLSAQYFESDLQDLEHICSELTLGPLDSQAWWETIEKNDRIFTGSLLPGENSNQYINRKRIEYRNKVVDALVAAANRLIEAGEIAQALWFAHKALSRDDTREDVYISLMQAQLEAGQRIPAVETYFACKKYLEDELGLKPSNRINVMYKQVVQQN